MCIVLSNPSSLPFCTCLARGFFEKFLPFEIRFTGRRFDENLRVGRKQALKPNILVYFGDRRRPFSWKTVFCFFPVQQTDMIRPPPRLRSFANIRLSFLR